MQGKRIKLLQHWCRGGHTEIDVLEHSFGQHRFASDAEKVEIIKLRTRCSLIRGHEDLCPLRAPYRMFPAGEQAYQFVTFRLVKFRSIAYVHQCLRYFGYADESDC